MAHRTVNHTNPVVIDATGYTPYAVERAKRAQGRHVDLEAVRHAEAIRSYWVKRTCLNELHHYVDRHGSDLFRSQWECSADKKGLFSRVQWEMNKVTSRLNKDLEKRRSNLSDLLKAENDMYLQEASCAQENVEDKTAHMAERYKELITKKEVERAKIAKEKQDEHFRTNCDELRGLLSKKVQREIVREGQQIMLEKKMENQQKNAEEKMYADMWIRDSEIKCKRAEEEEEFQRQKDHEFGRQIVEQMEKNKRDQHKKLLQKEQEAEIMAEQKRLLEMEEEWKIHAKKKKQEETKSGLDECLKAKLKQKTKEVQEDILEDLYYLRKMMEDDEKAKKANKKKTLMREQQQYLTYLQEQLKKETEFEKELDRTYQKEFEKMWEKRENEWEAEKKKRKQFEKEVLKHCEHQILFNIQKSREAHEMHKLFSQKVLEQDKAENEEDQLNHQLTHLRNTAHQKDILDQMQLKTEKLKAEEAQRARELEQMIQERKAHEERLQNLISEMKLDYLHPYRTKQNDASLRHG